MKRSMWTRAGARNPDGSMSAVVMIDVEWLVLERLAGDLDDPAVVLEERGAVDEHERSVEVVEPGRRFRRGLPCARPDEADLGGPVRSRVLERLGGVGEHERGGEVEVRDGSHRRQAELEAERVDVPGDEASEAAERDPRRRSRRGRGRWRRRAGRARVRTAARRAMAAAPARGRRTPTEARTSRPRRPLPTTSRRRAARRDAPARSHAGGPGSGSGLARRTGPSPASSAPKRVRARQSCGSKSTISAASGSASMPSERSSSTSLVPVRTVTRWPAAHKLLEGRDQRVEATRDGLDVGQEDRHRTLRRREVGARSASPASQRARSRHRADTRASGSRRWSPGRRRRRGRSRRARPA